MYNFGMQSADNTDIAQYKVTQIVQNPSRGSVVDKFWDCVLRVNTGKRLDQNSGTPSNTAPLVKGLSVDYLLDIKTEGSIFMHTYITLYTQ